MAAIKVAGQQGKRAAGQCIRGRGERDKTGQIGPCYKLKTTGGRGAEGTRGLGENWPCGTVREPGERYSAPGFSENVVRWSKRLRGRRFGLMFMCESMLAACVLWVSLSIVEKGKTATEW